MEDPLPLNIKVPVTEPIAITLKRIPRQTVHGRVLDAQHHPCGGVLARFAIFGNNPWPEEPEVMTDKNGNYQLQIPTGSKVSLLSLEGNSYRLTDYGLQTNNGRDLIGDAVMVPSTAVVQGKVCDTDGKPMPGATVVSMEGGLAIRAITDVAGAFMLPRQPACTLHLVAATPTGGGLATVSPLPPAKEKRQEQSIFGKNVLIICKPARSIPPCDTALALSLLEADAKLPHQQRQFNRTETLRLMADVDLEQVVRLCDNGKEPVAEGLRAYLLARQAEKAPAQVKDFLIQLNLLNDPACKLFAAVEMGLAVVKNDPALAEQLYLVAKPIYDSLPHGNDGTRHIEGLLYPGTSDDISLDTIALAALLCKGDDVDAMLAHLHMLTELNGDDDVDLITTPLAEAAGLVSPEFVCKVLNMFDADLKNTAQPEAYMGAFTSMAQHDPAAALRLEKMLDPAKLPNDSENIATIIGVLSKTDPAAALALANAKHTGLEEAAAFQPKDVAQRIIRGIYANNAKLRMETIARIAVIDPEYAKQLYDREQPRNSPEDSYSAELSVQYSMDQLDSSLKYAVQISSLDPVEARLMLETQYAWALSMAQHGTVVERLQYFPTAMVTLDLDRALEMMQANLKLDNPRLREGIRQRLMHYILMSRMERAAFGPVSGN